jgi:rhodanese-related sulfurtransferase
LLAFPALHRITLHHIMCSRAPPSSSSSSAVAAASHRLLDEFRQSIASYKWKGSGDGAYPTITPFQYTETLVFSALPNKPILSYSQFSFEKQMVKPLETPAPSKPLHTEQGFLRFIGDAIEMSVADPTGLCQVYNGTITEYCNQQAQQHAMPREFEHALPLERTLYQMLSCNTSTATATATAIATCGGIRCIELELVSDSVIGTRSAKPVESMTRVYRLWLNASSQAIALTYEFRMAAMGQASQFHLHASLLPVPTTSPNTVVHAPNDSIVHWADAKQQIGANKAGVLVDVREPAEYDAGHVDQVVHVPLATLLAFPQSVAQLSTADSDSKVFVHCGLGARARLATAHLREVFGVVRPMLSPTRLILAQ